MRLITVGDFRTRVGERDVSDLNDLMGSAIDKVTAILESLLRTTFKNEMITDTYHLDPKDISANGVTVPLLLSRSFVNSDVVPVISVGDTYAGLRIAPIPLAFTDVAVIDNGVGVVTLLENNHYEYISVTYRAGLVDDGTGYGAYTNVPEWLQEAAFLYAEAMYTNLKAWVNVDEKKRPSSPAISAPQDVLMIIAKHIRWRPTANQPFLTEIVPEEG